MVAATPCNGWIAAASGRSSSPAVEPGAQYKFEFEHAETGKLVIKTDPYAQAFVTQANTERTSHPTKHAQVARCRCGWIEDATGAGVRSPSTSMRCISVLGAAATIGSFLSYARLGQELASYARERHYTHIELLPVFEHPLDESLGYQVTGYFAPTSRFGTPDDFRSFVDTCHRSWRRHHLGLGAAPFPERLFGGLANSMAVRSTSAPTRRWQSIRSGTRSSLTTVGREVRNFLLANALYWLLEFHVDGLRVDAVSSMLYLDDARLGKHWQPNPLGGRENLPR